MTSYEKYEYWVMLSKYDIETAEILIESKRWPYVAFLCQQAVERLVKGMYVCHTNKEAPKSHNVPYLISKLEKNEKFALSEGYGRFKVERSKYEDFFIDLMFYYMSDYPFSYKKVMDRFISEKVARDVYTKSLEAINWLKGFQYNPELSVSVG